jgi:uncharacterized protein YecE (DUF72 family)
MAVDFPSLKSRAAALAQKGALIGTSSWKYPGWCGQLYDEARYVWKGRFSKHRFERLCLAEYAQVFKTVSVDAAYYRFPTCEQIGELTSQVPADFRFAFKVTSDVTLKHFTNLPRYGLKAGRPNENFLNASLFERNFLAPCRDYKSQIGLLIFEFSKFYPADFERGRDFVEALDQFLSKLPHDWNYGVEIRNRYFLKPEYFACLERHGITHVYTSWQDMPPLDEQLAMPDAQTAPALTACRMLLRPGRKYEDAVKLFSPYREIKDPYPEGRAAGAEIIRAAIQSDGKARAFVFVNNRFEGNALQTIDGIMDAVLP